MVKTRQLILKANTCGLTPKEFKILRRRTLAKKIAKTSALITLWTAFAGAVALLGGSVVTMLLNFWVL